MLEHPDGFAVTVRGKPVGQDRQRLAADHFTGMTSAQLEDIAVQESQGAIAERTKEHLGSSDPFITRARRLLIKAARDHRRTGEIFPDPHTVSLRSVRALAVDIAADQDWRTASG